MYEVLYASGFQVIHASRGTGNNEHCPSVKVFERRNGIFRILVIARTQHYYVGTGFQRGVNTLLDRLEAKVVNHLVTGASEEVTTELGTCLAHGEVAYGQHEGYGCLSAFFHLEAQVLIIGGETGCLNGLESSLVVVAVAFSA